MQGHYQRYDEYVIRSLGAMEEAGLAMEERQVESRQGGRIRVRQREVLNFCTNNYLGLANHPAIVAAAHRALDEWGYGLSAGRTLTGTQTIHRELEHALSAYLGTDDAVLHIACFDANAGLFEALLGEEDAVISDQLNHASIIDGIRLCKAQRHLYAHGDLDQLESILKETQGKRFRLIATDGVFSMDSEYGRLNEICDLAERYGALMMVDDSHATGFVGPKGRGTAAKMGVADRVDIITTTLGKAMGGAAGGFVTGRREIIRMVRARSRPYIFSNSVPPAMVGGALAALALIEAADDLRERLWANARRFREGIVAAGFSIKQGDHPIVPVMLGEAKIARGMARDLMDQGVFVVGFGYPIVPVGAARIRVINSAAHEPADVDFAIEKFALVGRRYRVIS